MVVADLLDSEGKELAHSLGDGALYVHLDVSDPDAWRLAVDETESVFGPVTDLVNNLGGGVRLHRGVVGRHVPAGA